MTAFAGGAEAGLAAFYTDANFACGISSAQRHQTLAGLGGNYSWYAYGGGNLPQFPSGDRYFHAWVKADVETWYIRFYIGGSAQASVRMSIFPALYRGAETTLLATAALARPSPEYRDAAHWVAIDLLAQDVGGTFTLWIDEAQQCTYAGDTQQAAVPNWDQILWSFTSANTYYDDVITTSAAEGRLPEQYCQVLRPSANVGGACAFTPVPAGAGTNWDRVNEVPASQTDYCEALALGQEDVYDLTDPSPFSTVYCAVAWAWSARDGAFTQARTGISSAAGGATSYRTYCGLPASPGWGSFWQVQKVDPNTGAAWTTGGLNDARFHIQGN